MLLHQGGKSSIMVSALRLFPREAILNVPARELAAGEWFEKTKERKKKIQSEMRTGYFDDISTFRDSGGKVIDTSKELIPSATANAFPETEFLRPDRTTCTFPPHEPTKKATLACISFREGAKRMMLSWSDAFGKGVQDSKSVGLCHISLVESRIMSVWPFQGMVLGSTKRHHPDHNVAIEHLYRFGSANDLCTLLGMPNKLTAYAFLLDPVGRIRWRASGEAQQDEIGLLLECTNKVLSCGETK